MQKFINVYRRIYISVIIPFFVIFSVFLFMSELCKICLCKLNGTCVVRDIHVYRCLLFGFGSFVGFLSVNKFYNIPINQNITRHVQLEPEHGHRQRRLLKSG